MIDPQTGYDDTLFCECKPCPDCEGEGSGTNYCDDRPNGIDQCRIECVGHEWKCRKCNGTGLLTGECEIHDKVTA